jgi:hypothetical protein
MLSNLFGKKIRKVDYHNTNKSETHNFTNMQDQITWLTDNGWVNGNTFNKSNKNILIMDDRQDIISAVIDDLERMDETEIINLNHFNLITVSSKNAGFHVLDILEKAPNITIDYALLDIVLGGKKIVDGVKQMVDGVDVAIQIWERFSTAQILFFSGCIIENSNDRDDFKNRFTSYTQEDISDYLLPKDIDFDSEIDQLATFFNGF